MLGGTVLGLVRGRQGKTHASATFALVRVPIETVTRCTLTAAPVVRSPATGDFIHLGDIVLNTSFRPTLAAAVIAACALATVGPVTHAANVGYTTGCFYGGQEGRPEIVAAGHTPVALPSYDLITAPSLVGLSAVLVSSCFSGTNAAVDSLTNAAVDTAVANGMSLLVHDNRSAPDAGDRLPGSYVFGVSGGVYGADIDFTAAAPFLQGPAGTLNNTTLDGGASSNHESVPAASLAAGIRILATAANPAEVTILDYAHVNGRVVYSTIPLGCYLSGGSCAAGGGLDVVSAGMQRYATNLVATYAVPAFTTCAAQGFIGPKLTLCRSICEVDQPSSTLINRIKLYTAIYRQAPPCGL